MKLLAFIKQNEKQQEHEPPSDEPLDSNGLAIWRIGQENNSTATTSLVLRQAGRPLACLCNQYKSFGWCIHCQVMMQEQDGLSSFEHSITKIGNSQFEWLPNNSNREIMNTLVMAKKEPDYKVQWKINTPNNTQYIIKLWMNDASPIIACNCPSWIHSGNPRQCKHLWLLTEPNSAYPAILEASAPIKLNMRKK